jgi:hypothetical protein
LGGGTHTLLASLSYFSSLVLIVFSPQFANAACQQTEFSTYTDRPIASSAWKVYKDTGCGTRMRGGAIPGYLSAMGDPQVAIPASHGTATFNENLLIHYQPSPGYVGDDHFSVTYRQSLNGGQKGMRRVNIDIQVYVDTCDHVRTTCTALPADQCDILLNEARKTGYWGAPAIRTAFHIRPGPYLACTR